MEIKKLVSAELSGWTNTEKIFVPLLLLLILWLSVSMQDSKIATASAFFGLLYTILAGKGKISCYFFGMIGTLCYSYLSWENALYGNLLLYIGYYFPMEIWGIFAWSKNLKKNTREVKKTFLSHKELILISISILLFSLIASVWLRYFNDSSPFLDGFVTVLSVAGMYLTVKRCIEQWVIWTIANFLSVIIWFKIFIAGGKTFATLLMWLIYLFLGIYFFFKWKKEMSEEKN